MARLVFTTSVGKNVRKSLTVSGLFISYNELQWRGKTKLNMRTQRI
jgi:hypothetical protein